MELNQYKRKQDDRLKYLNQIQFEKKIQSELQDITNQINLRKIKQNSKDQEFQSVRYKRKSSNKENNESLQTFDTSKEIIKLKKIQPELKQPLTTKNDPKQYKLSIQDEIFLEGLETQNEKNILILKIEKNFNDFQNEIFKMIENKKQTVLKQQIINFDTNLQNQQFKQILQLLDEKMNNIQTKKVSQRLAPEILQKINKAINISNQKKNIENYQPIQPVSQFRSQSQHYIQ